MAIMTIIISAGVPLFVRYLQKADAEHQALAQLRKRELDAASKTFDDVSETLSGLLYHVREALYGAIYDAKGTQNTEDEEKQQIWGAYREKMIKWEEGRVRFLAGVEEYFGSTASDNIKDIDMRLRTLMRRVSATHYGRTKSQNYLRKGETSQYYRTEFFDQYDDTDRRIQQLNRYMITAIQNRNVGALRPDRQQ